MNDQAVNYVKQAVADFFKSWPLDPKIEVNLKDDFVVVDIDTKTNDIFIRPTPEPLLAVQHLIRLMARKQFPNQVIKISVDIGGFRQRRQEVVKQIAKEAVDKAINSNSAVNLLPMSSFERRLVHTYIAEEGKTTSESAGVGRDRYVVIKPKN